MATRSHTKQTATTAATTAATPAKTTLVHEGWIDYARAVCAIAVCFLHVWDAVTASNSIDDIGLSRALLWGGLQTALGRYAVPVFLMISGYLLLNREKDVSVDRCLRYAWRMVVVLATFGLAFCIIESAFVYGALNLDVLGDAVMSVLSGDSWDHMWYVYTMLGIYLILPLLKRFSQTATKREWHLVLGALLVFPMAVNTLDYLVGANFYNPLPISGSAVFYVLLGGYLRTFGVREDRAIRAGVASLVLCVVAQVAYAHLAGEDPGILRAPQSPFVVVWAVGVFYAFKVWGSAPGRVPGQLVMSLSRCSFAIYLVNPVFYNVIYKVVGATPLTLPAGTSALLVLADVAVSWALAAILRRLPVLRKVL